MKRSTRVLAAAAAAGTLVLVAGAAAAYWTGSGAGLGPAVGGTTAPVALAAGTVSPDLAPGFPAAVSTVATNPNSAEVRIGSLALNTAQGTGGFAVTGDSPAGGCPASSFSFATQTAGWTVAANASAAITLPNAVSLAANAANACQGATVTVYLVAGA